MRVKKFALFFLSVVFLFCSALGLTACEEVKGEKGEQGIQGEQGEQGEPGVGIESIDKITSEGNIDVYEIKFTDGKTTVFTVRNGLDGENGEDGVSIVEAEISEEGELLLLFSDSRTPINLGKVVGKDGKDGVSIEEAQIDASGNLILKFTDNGTFNLGNVVGSDGETPYIGENGNWWIGETDTGVAAKGQDGANGIGITGTELTEDGELVVRYSNGEFVNLGAIVGVGIKTISLEDGLLSITLTNGTELDLGNIKGEQGAAGQDGKSAYELYKEHYVYEGTEEEWLMDLVNGNLATTERPSFTFALNAAGDGYILTDYIGDDAAVEIPAEYQGKPVVQIGRCAFADCRQLTSVTIPGSVKSIEEFAFSGCTKLQQLNMEEGLLTIANYAFSECYSLYEVVLPESLKVVTVYAFEFCRNAMFCISLPNVPERWNLSSDYCVVNFDGNTGITESGIRWAGKKDGTVVVIGYSGEGYYVDIPETIGSRTVSDIMTYAFLNDVGIIVVPESLVQVDIHIMDGFIFYRADVGEDGAIDNYAGEYGITENGILWAQRKDSTIMAVAYFGSETYIEIPEQINGMPVADFGREFFDNLQNVLIKLPSTVEKFSAYNDNVVFLTEREELNFDGSNIIKNYAGEYGITDDGFTWAKRKDGTVCIIWYSGSAKEISIPSQIEGDSVTELLSRLFREIDRQKIESIFVPSSIQTIAWNAFNDLDGGKSIILTETEHWRPPGR